MKTRLIQFERKYGHIKEEINDQLDIMVKAAQKDERDYVLGIVWDIIQDTSHDLILADDDETISRIKEMLKLHFNYPEHGRG